jgi:hypothetical protein
MFSKMKTKSSLQKFCKGSGILALYQFMKKRHPDLCTDADKKYKSLIKKEGKASGKGKKVISC